MKTRKTLFFLRVRITALAFTVGYILDTFSPAWPQPTVGEQVEGGK